MSGYICHRCSQLDHMRINGSVLGHLMALQSLTSWGAETQTVDIEKIMGTAFGAKAEITALRGQFLVEIQREDVENEQSAAARAAAQQARREAKQEAEANVAAAAAAASLPSDASL